MTEPARFISLKNILNACFIGPALWLSLSLFGCSGKSSQQPVTILQLQEMSDMATAEYVVSKIVKASDNPTWYKYGERKTLISVQARIKAGIDMRELQAESFEISDNSIRLLLPPPKIISMNIDPRSIKQEYEWKGFFRSSFSNEERYLLLQQAEDDIRKGIEGMGILETASLNAALFFESWFRLMGYEQVEVLTSPGTGDLPAKLQFPEIVLP